MYQDTVEGMKSVYTAFTSVTIETGRGMYQDTVEGMKSVYTAFTSVTIEIGRGMALSLQNQYTKSLHDVMMMKSTVANFAGRFCCGKLMKG